MSVQIQLTREEVAWCVAEGRRTEAQFSGKPGHYQTNNSVLNHVIAKLGECAVEKWLGRVLPDQPLDPVFRHIGRMSECDIIAPGRAYRRLEVKTWNARTWPHGGRCVSPTQAPKIVAKSDAVVWCRIVKQVSMAALTRGETVTVEVMGWSTPREIAAIPLTNTSFDETERLNHQVAENDLRQPEALVAALKG